MGKVDSKRRIYTHFKIEEDVLYEFKEQCYKNNITPSAMIRLLLNESVKNGGRFVIPSVKEETVQLKGIIP
jgi:antitoxin component of RelBE/YafQ-DinJ toxin-antitoxin module